MLLAIAASAVAVTVSPAGAVTGNFVPDNTHNYVVLIAFYDEERRFSLALFWLAAQREDSADGRPLHGYQERCGVGDRVGVAGGWEALRPVHRCRRSQHGLPERVPQLGRSSRVPPRTRCWSTATSATSSCKGTTRTSAC